MANESNNAGESLPIDRPLMLPVSGDSSQRESIEDVAVLVIVGQMVVVRVAWVCGLKRTRQIREELIELPLRELFRFQMM